MLNNIYRIIVKLIILKFFVGTLWVELVSLDIHILFMAISLWNLMDSIR